jgi:hypothetical protein
VVGVNVGKRSGLFVVYTDGANDNVGCPEGIFVVVGLSVPVIGAGVVGGACMTPFGQSACAKHSSPGGQSE